MVWFNVKMCVIVVDKKKERTSLQTKRKCCEEVDLSECWRALGGESNRTKWSSRALDKKLHMWAITEQWHGHLNQLILAIFLGSLGKPRYKKAYSFVFLTCFRSTLSLILVIAIWKKLQGTWAMGLYSNCMIVSGQ